MNTMAASSAEAGVTSTATRPTLRASASVFARYGSPRIILLVAVGAVVARLVMQSWSLGDLLVCVGILAVEPFVEWVIHVFLLLPVLFAFLAILFAIAWFAFPTRALTMTAFSTFTSFLFGYEWTHFLIHSPYVPRSRIFRTVWRAHILHHYKNEKYWFGVTNPIADHVLRTHPAKEQVESSPTARTLGVDDEFTLIGQPTAA
jgi:hypothetical protein